MHYKVSTLRLTSITLMCLCLALLGWAPFALASTATTTSNAATTSRACPSLLNHQFARLQDEQLHSLCQHTGKVVMIVNTASFCGYTPQYEGLEKLNARFAKQGLVIVGFPSNDFGAQEPGTAKQISELCFNTYAVKFPMMSKTVVKGAQANALYQQLAQTTGAAPKWNFHKYLIGRDGKTVVSYDSNVEPMSSAMIEAVEKALLAPATARQ